MKEIIYNKEREKSIRKTDLGRILKVMDKIIGRLRSSKKENLPTAMNALREAKRRIKENKPE